MALPIGQLPPLPFVDPRLQNNGSEVPGQQNTSGIVTEYLDIASLYRLALQPSPPTPHHMVRYGTEIMTSTELWNQCTETLPLIRNMRAMLIRQCVFISNTPSNPMTPRSAALASCNNDLFAHIEFVLNYYTPRITAILDGDHDKARLLATEMKLRIPPAPVTPAPRPLPPAQPYIIAEPGMDIRYDPGPLQVPDFSFIFGSPGDDDDPYIDEEEKREREKQLDRRQEEIIRAAAEAAGRKHNVFNKSSSETDEEDDFEFYDDDDGEEIYEEFEEDLDTEMDDTAELADADATEDDDITEEDENTDE